MIWTLVKRKIARTKKTLKDRNSIVVKICRLHSHIPIDETSAKIVDCELLDLRDTECFVDSLMKRSASRFIERQDEKQDILDENKPIEMSGELDLQSMVGKVVMGKVDDWRKKPMNMRKIELWVANIILKN